MILIFSQFLSNFSVHANLSQQFVLMNNFPFFTYLSYFFFFFYFMIFVIFHLSRGVFMTETESQNRNAGIIYSFPFSIFLSFSLLRECFPSRGLFFLHIFVGNYCCHLSYHSEAKYNTNTRHSTNNLITTAIPLPHSQRVHNKKNIPIAQGQQKIVFPELCIHDLSFESLCCYWL